MANIRSECEQATILNWPTCANNKFGKHGSKRRSSCSFISWCASEAIEFVRLWKWGRARGDQEQTFSQSSCSSFTCVTLLSVTAHRPSTDSHHCRTVICVVQTEVACAFIPGINGIFGEITCCKWNLINIMLINLLHLTLHLISHFKMNFPHVTHKGKPAALDYTWPTSQWSKI